MSKPLITTHDLSESDFRKISNLLKKRHGLEFTLDYIRKVCKGKRKNDQIMELAERYVILLNELEERIKQL